MSIIYNAYNIDINITHINITLINIYVFIYNPPLRSYCKNVRIYCNYSTVKMYTIVITVKMYVLYCKRRPWPNAGLLSIFFTYKRLTLGMSGLYGGSLAVPNLPPK